MLQIKAIPTINFSFCCYSLAFTFSDQLSILILPIGSLLITVLLRSLDILLYLKKLLLILTA